jgi:hypothetical protein
MPKTTFISCLLLLLTTAAKAQGDELFGTEQKVFEGRLIMGLNFTQVDGDTYNGYHKVGINAGGMVYVHFGKKTGISMEMLYTQKGARGANARESFYVGTYLDKYYLNLNYLEIPVLFHLKRGIYIDYEAGLSYALLLRSGEWGYADVPVLIQPEFNYFNTSDICYVGGASFRLSKRWRGNIRLQYSAKYIRPGERTPEHYYQSQAGQQNNVVSMRMMYTL